MTLIIPPANKVAGQSGFITDIDNLYSAVAQLAASVVLPSGDTTGATDATAFANAYSASGALTLFPGDYYVNSVVQYPGNSATVGPGMSLCTVHAVGSLSAVFATSGWTASTNANSVPPVRMAGFAVDAAGTATYGIVSQNYWSNFEYLLLKNDVSGGLRFDAFGLNGTSEIGNTAVENHVTNCQFRLNGGPGFRSSDNLSNQHFTDGWLTDCIFQGPGSSGTSVLAQVDSLAGWKVHGNHFYGAPLTAFTGQRLFSTRITGNYVEPWGTSTTLGTYAGIGLDGLADNGFGGSVIAGNTLAVNASTPGNAGSTIDGISVRAVSGGSATVSITGNTIANPEVTSATYRGAITLQAQSATATLTAVTTGNTAGSGWNTAVDIILNGGTVNHTTGV